MISNHLAQRVLTAVIYGLVPGFLVYALLYDFNPSGVRAYEYHLDRPIVGISKLFPAQRLAGTSGGKQRMMRQPVYMTVRYPHRYERALVRIAVENPQQVPWRVGMEVGGSEWSYFMESPSADGTVSFDLANARVTNRSARFMIAVDGLTDETPFFIDRIAVQLTRKAL